MSRPAKRPGSVTFVAIVLFLFGTIYLLNSIATIGMVVVVEALPEPPANAKIQPGDIVATQRFFAKEVPNFTASVIVFSVVDLLFGVLQIVCGFGVLRLKPPARLAAMLLALAKFVYVLGFQIYSLMMIIPAQVRFMELHPPEVPGGGPQPVDLALVTRLTSMAGFGLAIFMQIVLTILIVWLLNTAAAKSAFAGELEPPGETEEKPRTQYAGYEDDDAPA